MPCCAAVPQRVCSGNQACQARSSDVLDLRRRISRGWRQRDAAKRNVGRCTAEGRADRGHVSLSAGLGLHLTCRDFRCCVARSHSYRVSIFGFLAAEELRGRDKAAGSTGNYGIQGTLANDTCCSRRAVFIATSCIVNARRSACSHGMDAQAHCKLRWRSGQGLHSRPERRSEFCVPAPRAPTVLAILQLGRNGIRRILRRCRHGHSCISATNLDKTCSVSQLFYKNASSQRRRMHRHSRYCSSG